MFDAVVSGEISAATNIEARNSLPVTSCNRDASRVHRLIPRWAPNQPVTRQLVTSPYNDNRLSVTPCVTSVTRGETIIESALGNNDT